MAFWTAPDLIDEWTLPVVFALVRAGQLTPLPKAGPFITRAAIALQTDNPAVGMDEFHFDAAQKEACARTDDEGRSILTRYRELVAGKTGADIIRVQEIAEKPPSPPKKTSPLDYARGLAAEGVKKQEPLGKAIDVAYPGLSDIGLGRVVFAAVHGIPPERVTKNQARDAGRRARGKKK